MSKIKKVFVVLILVLFVAVLLLQIDDELSPDAALMLDSIEWQEANDAYLYLLGMGAGLGEAPLVEGSLVLEQIRKREVNYDSSLPYDEWEVYDERPVLKLPDYDSFCSYREPDCIASLFVESDIDLAQPLMVEFRKRYQTFLKLPGFTTMSRPHVFESFANFSLLIKTNRLMSLDAIEKASQCCPEEAMNELYELIELQKKHVAETDTLIGRMVAYVLLNETIDVLSLVIEKFDLSGRPISLLSNRELDLRRVINREFAFAFSSFDSPNFYQENRYTPEWAIKVVFKKNISVNTLLPDYKEAKRLSLLSQENFAREFAEGGRANVGRTQVGRANVGVMSWVRNLVGSYLYVSVGQPSLSSYIGRGFDLNSKITLFNGLLGESLNSRVLKGVVNPYYPDEYDASYKGDTHRVCLGGPFDDRGFVRCLITFKEYR